MFLKPGDHVVDATCGNGYDSLALAKAVLTQRDGFLTCMDVQQKALNATRSLLSCHLDSLRFQNISFHLGSHSHFPNFLLPPRLIVYNLGYLPGSDKSLTTNTEITLESLENALKILPPDGAVSMTCYPGHSEGLREENAILKFATHLDSSKYNVCHHKWLNRPLSPSLLLINFKNIKK